MKRQTQELTWGLQLTFLALLEAGLVCALWQKAHANLTLCVLGLAPALLLLSRIPYRYFPGFLRQLLQIGLAALGVIWLRQRSTEIPLDIALIECAAVFSLALFLGCRFGEHFLMGILAVAFAGYGGLTPGRGIFLPVFLVTLALGILLLYETRTIQLSRIGLAVPPPQPRYWGNWLYRGLHFALIVLLGTFLLIRFPIRERLRTRGLAPVSFDSEEDLEFPDIWKNWFAPTKKLITSDTETTATTEQNAEQPSVISSQTNNLMASPSAQTLDAREGNGGSSTIGKDLVFRAYTPAKLYWVMQIYDTYDGNSWTRSQSLLKGTSALDTYRPAETFPVVQTISIEKPLSLRMPYAFRPVNVKYRAQTTMKDSGAPGIILKTDAVSFMLRSRNLPEPPWHYRVQSLVPAPDLKKQPRAWNEPERNFGWSCRSLPRRVITPRLRKLAEDLTENLPDPLQKATAIRDYLRSNYKYNINVPPVPEDRECVDYFLFESKEGFCQHFAQAMVVLARLSGLHARLVTGYSPGKFNVMGNYFEIYEYHAHAWAHVFIEPYGWLTFDGVAPGDLNLQDAPSLLGSMLDPFGEKWTMAIPELTYTPPKAPSMANGENRKDFGKAVQTEDPTRQEDLLGDIYAKAALDNNTENPTNEQLLKAAGGVLRERARRTFAQSIAACKAKAMNGLHWLWGYLLRAIRYLAALPHFYYVGAGVILVFACGIYRNRRRIRAMVVRRWKLHQCGRLWKRIQTRSLPPERLVTACQKLNSSFLELAGFPRPPAADGLEYASLFPEGARHIAPDYTIVAKAAFQTWYGNRHFEQAEAEEILSATRRFRYQIRPFLNHNRSRQHRGKA